MEAERDAPATLSTRTSTAWRFRSEHAEGDNPLPLPVSVIRFSPKLDARNTAPSGGTYRIPVRVERQPGSSAGGVRRLTVETSFDVDDPHLLSHVLDHHLRSRWKALRSGPCHQPQSGAFLQVTAVTIDRTVPVFRFGHSGMSPTPDTDAC
ncbi:hypothetical protein [Nonomuraea roseola]|uniref:Uncharacterized protein n=1 Tax=Nonomuraea roseola TaxID=46179 RepID=A0ABV5Q4E0_9ACTN